MLQKTIELEYKNKIIKISCNLRKGQKESLVFIHGLGCSKDSFKYVWRFNKVRKYTILIFDLLGFGNSSKPRDFSYDMDEHAEICRALIEKLNLEKIHLVGHSMGGAISLLLIKKIPSRVISFINLEGNLIGEDCTMSRRASSYSLKDFEERAFNELKSKIASKSRLFYNWISKSDPYAFYKSSKSLVEWSDSRKLLKRFIDLDIKKFYICGERNKNMPVIKFLDDVPKIQISNSGHLMIIDNPEEFYQKLSEIV